VNWQETYIFAGGGTGGHLYPAVALADKLKELRPDCSIHFVGTARGIESRVLPDLGYSLHLITVRGVVRSFTLKNLLAPFALLWSLLQCVVLLIKIKPTAVIGTGGYVSGPVLFVAGILNIPSLIQEQNSYPGATTRLLANVVDRIHVSFEDSKKYFKRTEKLVVSGNPVRKFDLSRDKNLAREKLGLATEAPTLLITGGSQGAHAINKVMLQSLEHLMSETPLQVIWSTGKSDEQRVLQETARFGTRILAAPYFSDMEYVLSAADLIVARSGALTLAELTLYGLPSILVPYPFAAANHQETNARTLQESGAAIVVLQDSLTAELMSATLKDLLADPEKLASMKLAAAAAAFPDATNDIVESILEIVKAKKTGGHREL
jgi:UDP-N-acetylglucosamine--N-acetylmuramyl-(pentapeptide) pyrophosphoryl-undecaprenol N-acetylglucosamine transferase